MYTLIYLNGFQHFYDLIFIQLMIALVYECSHCQKKNHDVPVKKKIPSTILSIYRKMGQPVLKWGDTLRPPACFKTGSKTGQPILNRVYLFLKPVTDFKYIRSLPYPLTLLQLLQTSRSQVDQ